MLQGRKILILSDEHESLWKLQKYAVFGFLKKDFKERRGTSSISCYRNPSGQ
jgi:hypothetical protein